MFNLLHYMRFRYQSMPRLILTRFLWLTILVTTLVTKGTAQITPPGLEGSRLVGWVALGFTQAINSKLALATYVGTSTQSSFGDYNLLEKPAISVINQEVSYQFSPHWQALIAGSLRSQSLYEEEAPYELENPGIRREFRTYGRLFFRHKQGNVNWTHSFRPEYRRFYTADWQDWATPSQIRLRLKSQLSVSLNTAKTTQFIVANELLGAINRRTTSPAIEPQWSSYRLTEDRFALFVRHLLPNPGLWVDTGLMNQFWWDTTSQKIRYTLYLSVDFIFRDPFSRKATK